MKRIFAALALLGLTFIQSADSQTVPFPQSLPPSTVIGRMPPVSGPAQAIPFTIFGNNLISSLSPIPIINGGTGQTTAATARAASGLNIESVHSTGDANVVISPSTRVEVTSAAPTTTRTWTLPAANSLNPGQQLIVSDIFGGVTTATPILVTAAGSDTIQGTLSVQMTMAFQTVVLISDGVSKWDLSGRSLNPTNLYVATTGNDSNSCAIQTLPCLTIQRAVSVATQYDWQGFGITINVAAGTYTKGVTVAGHPLGAASTVSGTNGAALTIKGAGSGTTTLGVTDCSSGVSGTGVFAGAQIYVIVQAITISNACSQIDLWADGGSTILTFTDVVLGSTGTSFAHVRATNAATVVISGSLTVSGNSTNGFSASSASQIIFSGGTITISGNPTIGTLLNAIDNSTVVVANATTWVGTLTGARYSLALGGMIDTEQNDTPLPGSLLGTVGPTSQYYRNAGKVCVGGAALCPVVTAPTGLGGAGTAAMLAGSGDKSGVVLLTAQAGAAALGVVHVSLASNLSGSTGGSAFCIAGLADSSTAWNLAAGVHAFFTASTTAPDISISWFNNGVALGAGNTYAITYICL